MKLIVDNISAELCLHVRFDDKILVRVEKDVYSSIVITLHYVTSVQLQFDVRVQYVCTNRRRTSLCIFYRASAKYSSANRNSNSVRLTATRWYWIRPYYRGEMLQYLTSTFVYPTSSKRVFSLSLELVGHAGELTAALLHTILLH